MQFVRRALIGVAGVALAGVIAGMVAPKPAHAVVSTLVTVMNSAREPIPTVATEAQNAFLWEFFCALGANSSLCNGFPTFAVPANNIAVIDSVSAYCTFPIEHLGIVVTDAKGITHVLTLPGHITTNDASDVGLNFRSYSFGGASGTSISMFAAASSAGLNPSVTAQCDGVVSGHLISQ